MRERNVSGTCSDEVCTWGISTCASTGGNEEMESHWKLWATVPVLVQLYAHSTFTVPIVLCLLNYSAESHLEVKQCKYRRWTRVAYFLLK